MSDTTDDPEALFQRGRLHDEAKGDARDLAEAIRCYRLAADLGHIGAQSAIATMHATGEGVPKDDKEALRWFRQAAASGAPAAQYNLGIFYAENRKNFSHAAKWYRRAANQGFADAQNNLGLLYLNGTGVPKNLLEANFWFRVAGGQGNRSAIQNTKYIHYELTTEQFHESKQRAEAFQPSLEPLSAQPSKPQRSGRLAFVILCGAGIITLIVVIALWRAFYP